MLQKTLVKHCWISIWTYIKSYLVNDNRPAYYNMHVCYQGILLSWDCGVVLCSPSGRFTDAVHCRAMPAGRK